MTISKSNPELEDEQEIPVSQVLGALCIAGSASRIVCVRCVRLRAALPLEPCRSGERGPQVQMEQCQPSDTSSWLLCRGRVQRTGYKTNQSLATVSLSVLTVLWVFCFGCWRGCNLGTLGVRIHALTPPKICEPGLLNEG